jgi:hypothetical protein
LFSMTDTSITGGGSVGVKGGGGGTVDDFAAV